jgi:ABC-type transport system involved in multi-copper enzyme maturation permease subunit
MELLKLAKRPMTWILLVLLLGGLGFGDVVGFLNLRSVRPETHETILANLTLPGTFPSTISLFMNLGGVMLAILAASAIGSEYSWGTLRPILSTGVSRWRFLAAKLLVLGLAAAVFLALAVLMNALLAVPIAALSGRPVFAGAVDASWFADLAAMLGRGLLAVWVPMCLAFLFGVVAQSQAVGVGVALGVTIGEFVVANLLSRLGLAWADEVVRLMLFSNDQVLRAHNVFGPAPDLPAGAVSQERALLTLLAYGAICVAAALVLFVRRDIRGAA